MEDWNVSTPIQINVSGHDAATLNGLPGSFYLNAANLTGTIDPARIPGIDWSKIITGKPTTLVGYGITNAYTKAEVDTSLSSKQNISDELIALSNLADTPGLVRKTGNGAYSIDANNYLTNNSSGSGLTSLNASNLSSGTVAEARLPTIPSTKLSGVMDLASDQECIGEKTFKLKVGPGGNIRMYHDPATYGVIHRVDSDQYYIMITGVGDVLGTWSSPFPMQIVLATKQVIVGGNIAATSTTTGAFRVVGGASCTGDFYANSLNGQLQLRKLTSATRPVPSSATEGQVWYNIDTKNIEFATNTAVKVVTAV